MAEFDIPTISVDMLMELTSWTSIGMSMNEPISRPPSTRAQMLYGIGAGNDHPFDALHGHSSFVDPFELDGQRVAANYFYHVQKDMGLPSFDMSFPQGGYHVDSPRSEDSSQSGDTFSASCYTDDLNTQVFHHQTSINSPAIMQEPYFNQGYSTAHSPQLPPVLGGGISLGEVQNFEDQIQEFQDSAYTSEPDAEGESDHDYPSITVLEAPAKRCAHHEEIIHRPSVSESAQDSMSEDFEPEEEEEDGDYNPGRGAGKRNRRGPSRKSSNARRASTSTNGGRITKSRTRKPSAGGAVRAFPCPLKLYGCDATFTSKNEWKRHVSTQHIKLGFWRCDMCSIGDPENPNYNDFNRKDLFTQHLRRMHRNHELTTSTYVNDAGVEDISDDSVLEHQLRCYLVLRQNPADSTCLFSGCKQTFHGEGSWEERMEHVGTHMEKDRKANRPVVSCDLWHEDLDLRAYLENEGLIAYENGTWSMGNGRPKRDLGF